MKCLAFSRAPSQKRPTTRAPGLNRIGLGKTVVPLSRGRWAHSPSSATQKPLPPMRAQALKAQVCAHPLQVDWGTNQF